MIVKVLKNFYKSTNITIKNTFLLTYPSRKTRVRLILIQFSDLKNKTIFRFLPHVIEFAEACRCIWYFSKNFFFFSFTEKEQFYFLFFYRGLLCLLKDK